MMVTFFSKRSIICLFGILSFITACAESNSFRNPPVTRSYENVIAHLAGDIHKQIYSASLDGKIPPSLDVAIYKVIEQSSGREYLFGQEIKRDLLRKLRQQLPTTQSSSGSPDIYYKVERSESIRKDKSNVRIGNLLQAHLYQPFTQSIPEPSMAKVAAKLGVNLILRGEYRLLDNGNILINMQISFPQQNQVIGEREIRLNNPRVLKHYYKTSFSDGIKEDFEILYKQLKVLEIEEFLKVVDLKWQEEFLWKQKEEVRLLLVDKVEISFNNLVKQLEPLSFVNSLGMMKKKWRENLYSYLQQVKIQNSISGKLGPHFQKLRKALVTSDFTHFQGTAGIHGTYLAMIDRIKQKSFWEINDILERFWRPDYTDEHKNHLLTRVHLKLKSTMTGFEEFIPDVRRLRKRRINVRSLKRSILLNRIDYVLRLSTQEKERLMVYEKRLFLIEKALRDEFKVTV
ncbi:MAG: hypothetical protein GY786_06280, partial [Proteobacteria bacterium]|nr:hypothetical protein [Pseudomonadota bacterium]